MSLYPECMCKITNWKVRGIRYKKLAPSSCQYRKNASTNSPVRIFENCLLLKWKNWPNNYPRISRAPTLHWALINYSPKSLRGVLPSIKQRVSRRFAYKITLINKRANGKRHLPFLGTETRRRHEGEVGDVPQTRSTLEWRELSVIWDARGMPRDSSSSVRFLAVTGGPFLFLTERLRNRWIGSKCRVKWIRGRCQGPWKKAKHGREKSDGKAAFASGENKYSNVSSP